MCFIAGTTSRERLRSMAVDMKHRAPDGFDSVQHPGFFVGMGRLAIIDLKSPGLCPYRNDQYTLAFNGEIFNYIEIRKELKKLGWKFYTTSDSEVLLKAYRQWGVKCLDKFNGMFAFAIADDEKVFLARDVAGEKPLYYRFAPDFEFASEAKALDFMCQEFPAAHYGIYNLKTKRLKIERYWKLKKIKIDPKKAEAQLEALLEDAVKIRTRSDVPYALYYSGGIDSSLLATFHNYKYKLSYKDGNHKKDFLKIAPKMFWHLDYPIDSFSPYGLWKLAQQAKRKKIKVVISGEGADELFGGYIRYMPDALAFQARRHFPSYSPMFPYQYKDRKFFDIMNPIDAMGYAEFEGNLKTLLRMGDRMASAFGIENRCPFLDKRIIQFAFSLPPELKVNGFDTKVILRRILARRNSRYKDIEKRGLFCSVNKWIGSKDKFGKTDYLAFQNKYHEQYRDQI